MSSSHGALHLWYESNGFLIWHGIAAIDVGLVIPLLLPEHGMCRIHNGSGTFAIFAADEKERIHVFFSHFFFVHLRCHTETKTMAMPCHTTRALNRLISHCMRLAISPMYRTRVMQMQFAWMRMYARGCFFKWKTLLAYSTRSVQYTHVSHTHSHTHAHNTGCLPAKYIVPL